MIRVLFVCLGNICRSPIAEGVLRQLVQETGLSDQIEIDSAATSSYHIGEPAHRGAQRVLAQNGIRYQGRSRQIRYADFGDFDYLIAMDTDNMRDLQRVGSRAVEGKVYRLLDFASRNTEHDVPDPYYTGDFEHVYQLVEDGCQGLLDHIRNQHSLNPVEAE